VHRNRGWKRHQNSLKRGWGLEEKQQPLSQIDPQRWVVLQAHRWLQQKWLQAPKHAAAGLTILYQPQGRGVAVIIADPSPTQTAAGCCCSIKRDGLKQVLLFAACEAVALVLEQEGSGGLDYDVVRVKLKHWGRFGARSCRHHRARLPTQSPAAPPNQTQTDAPQLCYVLGCSRVCWSLRIGHEPLAARLHPCVLLEVVDGRRCGRVEQHNSGRAASPVSATEHTRRKPWKL